MKVLAIVQARMGSIRLPGKVIKKIGDKTLIQILLERLSLSSEIDEIIVATSTDSINDDLQSHIESLGFNCFRGNEKDVLNRYFESATEFKADAVVRITGDCPLVDAILVDEGQNFKSEWFTVLKRVGLRNRPKDNQAIHILTIPLPLLIM